MLGNTVASPMEIDHSISLEDDATYDENAMSDGTPTSDLDISFDESTISATADSSASDTDVTSDEDLAPFISTSLPSLTGPIYYSHRNLQNEIFFWVNWLPQLNQMRFMKNSLGFYTI